MRHVYLLSVLVLCMLAHASDMGQVCATRPDLCEIRKPKSVVKVTRLSPMDVGVSCVNGAKLTQRPLGDTLILSCGIPQ